MLGTAQIVAQISQLRCWCLGIDLGALSVHVDHPMYLQCESCGPHLVVLRVYFRVVGRSWQVLLFHECQVKEQRQSRWLQLPETSAYILKARQGSKASLLHVWKQTHLPSSIKTACRKSSYTHTLTSPERKRERERASGAILLSAFALSCCSCAISAKRCSSGVVARRRASVHWSDVHMGISGLEKDSLPRLTGPIATIYGSSVPVKNYSALFGFVRVPQVPLGRLVRQIGGSFCLQ